MSVLTVWCRTCGDLVEGLLEYENHVRQHEFHNDTAPATINEINALFEDLALEIYFGANFRHVLMNCSDATIKLLQQIVEQAKADRNVPQV